LLGFLFYDRCSALLLTFFIDNQLFMVFWAIIIAQIFAIFLHTVALMLRRSGVCFFCIVLK
jgi:hypothetical protein